MAHRGRPQHRAQATHGGHWHGPVTRKHATAGGEQNQAVPFGIVERFGPDGQWELHFDTLPVLTDPATISNLLAQLATP